MSKSQETIENQDSQREEEILPRRNLFSLGALTALIGACNETAALHNGTGAAADINVGNVGDQVGDVSTDDPVTGDGNPDDPPEDTPGSDPDPLCTAEQLDGISLDGFPAASPELTPQFRFYGENKAAMIVLDFNLYDPAMSDKMVSLSLHRPDGFIIALHRLTGADVFSPNRLRPIVIENVGVPTDKDIVCLLNMNDGTVFRFDIAKAQIAYEATFRGDPVVHLKPYEVDAMFPENQAIANIDAPSPYAGFTTSTDDKYKFGDRYLRTAEANAEFHGSARLAGFVICSLMGEVLAENGEEFSDTRIAEMASILEHPTIVCYKQGSGVWYRTIMTIG